ncbi:uncharacterized protein LOC143598437 [Bidens hawaiensis]|uniref:uncharacterized protein LOC143598437 n=1 Tax=Bidens hawaiensis TaxID=980011 RepID=UPI004049F20A
MTNANGTDVLEELEDVRAQKEKLEEQLQIKAELCKNLKRAQDEVITKLQEAKLQSEKQGQELSTKSEELSTLSQLHQDLKSSFQKKESAFKNLNSAHEKLRFEYAEKVLKFEAVNKELVLALEEAKTVSDSLQLKVDASNLEIEDLKKAISLKDKKILELSNKAQTTKDLIQRDEVISKLEEEYRDVQDQLKWKNEQFQHLEEAHKKLQDNFKSSKTEWENEKSLLLNEICSLQTNLDSQTRTSENLQTQLSICNQALAHEESNKKLLEVEISEYKSRFDDIFSECNEAKLTIEKLSHKRDEEVANLRDSLAAKDSLSKEMRYKLECLELENKDLTASVKEFQESQINSGNAGSLKKLQKKYNSLEQVHKKCSERLKREVEMQSELEKLRKEIDYYSTEVKGQVKQVKQLEEELKSCYSLQEIQNEEMSTVVLVLKTQFSETYRKLEQKITENEDMILHLKEELVKKVELIDVLKQRVLAEPSRKQKDNSQNHDGESSKDVLSQKLVELEKGKLFVESQNVELETENQRLLHKVNEQNENLVDLQQKLGLLQTLVTVRTEAEKKEKEKNLEIIEEKESCIKRLLMVVEEKKKKIGELENEFSCLCEKVKVKDECLLKLTNRADELEELLRVNRLETKDLVNENTRLVNNIEAQNERIGELLKEKTDALMIFEEKQKLENELSGLYEKIIVKEESLLKSKQRAEDLLRVNKLETGNFKDENMRLVSNLEAQNQRIEELMNEMTLILEKKQKMENELSGLCEKLKVKEESLLKSTQQAEELADLLRVNKLETENLMDENTRLVNSLEDQNRRIEELMKEKEKLENEYSGLCEKAKVKDESLLKSTKQVEALEDLLRVNKLEIKNLMDENTRLVNNLEAQNRRIEELMKEKTNASMIFEEKNKLENELFGLFESVKVKGESLLKSTHRAEELEELLRVNKLENKNLADEKTRLVNIVSNLESQNQALCEEFKKMTFHKDDLVFQMKTASKQMEEYAKDVELTGMLEKMLQRC